MVNNKVEAATCSFIECTNSYLDYLLQNFSKLKDVLIIKNVEMINNAFSSYFSPISLKIAIEIDIFESANLTHILGRKIENCNWWRIKFC